MHAGRRTSDGIGAEAAELLAGRARIISVSNHADARGCLTPFEFADFPFVPQRVFFVQDVPPNALRGGHAHARQQQILVCLAGRVAVRLVLRKTETTVVLDTPRRALFVDAGVWSQQRYLDAGTCLCVFASGPYDPAGYVYAPE